MKEFVLYIVCLRRAQGPRGRRDDPQPRAQVVRHGRHDL